MWRSSCTMAMLFAAAIGICFCFGHNPGMQFPSSRAWPTCSHQSPMVYMQSPVSYCLYAVTGLLWSTCSHAVPTSHVILQLHAQSGSYEVPILSYSYI